MRYRVPPICLLAVLVALTPPVLGILLGSPVFLLGDSAPVTPHVEETE